jgi:hypothetical protein
VWFFVFFGLMIIGGICAIGYWQTYDIKCGNFGGGRTWVWTKFPPGFQCASF